MTLSASEHSKVEAVLEEEQHYQQHAARRKTNGNVNKCSNGM